MQKLVIGAIAAVLAAPLALAGGDKAGGKSLTDLDADKDGRISRMEAMSDSEWSANFTKADTDGDGYLSQSEFTAANASMKPHEQAQPQSSTATDGTDASSTSASTSTDTASSDTSAATASSSTAADSSEEASSSDTESDSSTRTAESESTTPPRR